MSQLMAIFIAVYFTALGALLCWIILSAPKKETIYLDSFTRLVKITNRDDGCIFDLRIERYLANVEPQYHRWWVDRRVLVSLHDFENAKDPKKLAAVREKFSID